MNQIVPPSFLFHYSLGLPREDRLPGPKGSLVPGFVPALMMPFTMNSEEQNVRIRAAWNDEGIGLSVHVSRKSMPPSGRWQSIANSDHLTFCLDTRHTANVHRFTEYCLSFRVLVSDDDADDAPTIRYQEVAQQRTSKVAFDPRRCRVERKDSESGYQLDLWVPATQIPGFADAIEIGHVGFYLIVHDVELGEIPLSVGGDFPVTYDPSTWIQLELQS